VAVNSNLPAIKSTLDRDLRTWTDRVRDTLNATGDNRLVRYGELVASIDGLKETVLTQVAQQALTQTAAVPGAGGGFNSNNTTVNNFGLPNGLVADLYAQIEKEILESALAKELTTPFIEELQKKIADARTRIDDARRRMETIRKDFEAKASYQEANATAAVYQEYIARKEGEAVIAESLELLDAKVGDTEAAVLNEQAARASADEALLTTTQLLDGRVADNAASILNEQTARVNGDEALLTTVQLLDGRVGSTEASILNEQTARATADSALSESISSNYTTLNGRVAAVEVKASSIDGVLAQYTVKLNSNGKVSGIGLMNDGMSSAFVVQADRFAVVSANDTGYKAPFFVENGQTFIDTAMIKQASIDAAKLSGVNFVVEQYADFSWGSGTFSGVVTITINDLAPGETAQIVASLNVMTGFPPSAEFSVTSFNIGGWIRSYYTHISQAFSTRIYGAVGNGSYPVPYSVNTAGLALPTQGALSIRAVR